MMRYLQHDMLKRNRLTHFDCWASAFGETTTAIELAPEGTGYRARTRFAKFFNLPELMNLFREAADIKTADQLKLPTPTPVYHNEVSQPTALQKQMVQELSERAAKVHAGSVDATGYMDTIRDSIEDTARDEAKRLKELPVYPYPAGHARERGELNEYHASLHANVSCKEAIEAAIREHYRDNRLDAGAAVGQVCVSF